jgi:hypothetical protein
MIAATHTANKDVSGFLGGLDPMVQSEPTTLSVLSTLKGGDLLSPEEVPALRMKTRPRGTPSGLYTPADFLKARLKRAGLYHMVLPGKDETFPNLFYEASLSDGSQYPINGWVQKANKLAYANNLPVRVAEYARLISSGMVYAIAACVGQDADPEKVKLADLVSKIETRLKPELPPDASKVRRLAFACLNGRELASGYDIRRSPIAELVLSCIDEKAVEDIGKASRGLLFPVPQPKAYLALLNKAGLSDVVEKVKDQMEISAHLSSKPRIAELLGKTQIAPFLSGPANPLSLG